MIERLNDIKKRIINAALSCGRNPEEIKVVAVSKTMPIEKVKEAINAGAVIFGENYIQESREKITELSAYPVSWHFIGHLQSNKAKYAVKYFDVIHTVDSLKLAAIINREAVKIGKVQDILIQVNTGMESSKSGTLSDETLDLVKKISVFTNLRIDGLMTIPPLYNEPERVAPYFSMLRELRDSIKSENISNVYMDELSMGMTGDFEVAIKEGATIVRIGTAIFGKRK
ncbi:MAG: YggS family pyridoxal phosphate-dependent enzyme [Desulfobacterales bacterium]|nr:YggS family pyridoxal phosphate-dependent enzyme [Desulfobacteraceae bacterium]MBT4365111.1 YggS family pyridoxal phosphate-dependent enzyme [Desulfobacteraceae bacterium]MBT7085564.1 YggS family pyridoxal phosphate-dependent enzyme [Desulfobacterales bacterium]MBT7697505.1 YggS family pyridoxal phosphate-dependent enzyme [Desulfobacterales bacterium]